MGEKVFLVPGFASGFLGRNYFQPVKSWLTQDGYDVHTYIPPAYNVLKAEPAVALLEKKLEGYDDVLFVTHSRGGLLVRQLLKQSPSARKVAGVVYAGVPFNGAGIAKKWSWLFPACEEMTAGSQYLARLSEGLEPDIPALNIYSRDDEVVEHPSAYASFLPPQQNIEFSNVLHNDLMANGDVYDEIKAFFATTRQKANALANAQKTEEEATG